MSNHPHSKAEWERKLTELEAFFSTAALPSEPIRLDRSTKITDIQKFISAHISIAKANAGNPVFYPYLERLETVKNIIDARKTAI